MLRLQPLKRGDYLILIHTDRIRDHARGLFEAEASVVVSAAHPFQDVQIFFLCIHNSSTLIRLEVLRKSHFLSGDRLHRCTGLAVLKDLDSDTDKNPPRRAVPDRFEDHKGILRNRPRRLVATDERLKLRRRAAGQGQRRYEALCVAFELTVRQTR